MRLGVSVSEEIRKEFHAAVEETCQALGIRHGIEDRREPEGWTRSICMISPAGFSSGADAVEWAKEVACQIAERVHSQEAVSSRKYCGAWIDLEEKASAQEKAERQEESCEPGEDSEHGEGEDGELF